MTVARKPGHRGEHEATVKTIARGMPGDPGVTVVTNARAFYTTRAAAGASSARHSLRPLQNPGVSRCGIAESCLEALSVRQQHGVRRVFLAALGAPIVIMIAGRPEPRRDFPVPCELTIVFPSKGVAP